jgi:hypothetical protein
MSVCTRPELMLYNRKYALNGVFSASQRWLFREITQQILKTALLSSPECIFLVKCKCGR